MNFLEVIDRDGSRCFINVEKISLISDTEALGSEIFLGSEDYFVGTDIPLDVIVETLKQIK